MTGNQLLDAIPQAEFDQLWPHLQDVQLKRESVLVDCGEATRHVYFPVSGLISCLSLTSAGEQLEVYAAGRCDIVGLMGVWAHRQFLRAKVQVAGKAAVLDAKYFLRLVGRVEEVRQIVCGYLQSLVVKIAQRVSCTSFHDTQQRLSLWLSLASIISGELDLSCTRQSIAETIGARRATVSVMLSELEQRGVLRRHRGRISIMNLDKLEELACGCLEILRPEKSLWKVASS